MFRFTILAILVIALACIDLPAQSNLTARFEPGNAAANTPAQSPEGACAFPTKPGVYPLQGWTYRYEIMLPGTKSECRIGTLMKDGQPISGKLGQVILTPLGQFKYFEGDRYNQGWLNTLTYDRPVKFAAGGTDGK
jgi:hypothetical protein